MVKLCVLLLIGSVLWIFGTLPWLAINYFICSSSAPSICRDPDAFRQKALLILMLDVLLIAVSVFSIRYLSVMQRHLRR